MNIRDLQYLVAVAELQHFGRAAQRCHVSQPTLSMQIRKLEDYLGVPLFERAGRKVLVSSAGEQIVELLLSLRDRRGMTILLVTNDDGIAEVADRTLRLRDGHVGELAVAVTDVGAPRSA